MGTWHFIALWPADADAPALAAIGDQLAAAIPGARPQPVERIHLTIAFLGQCSPRDVVVAAQAAADAALTTGRDLMVRVDQVDLFGNKRVLAALPDSQAAGTLLHAREIAVSRLRHGGVKLDERSFRPHLSLARVDATGDPAATAPVSGLPLTIRLDRISLVASIETGEGPRSWRNLETWPLEQPRR